MPVRLLIAEDELDLAEVLTVFFEKNHFAVDTVHNGFDAYEYGVSGAYDAIILDVMMPKMNGIEVLQKLRAEHCGSPIMMLTAKGETGDRITGFNAGADDYLPKPFDPDELISRVRAMLRRSENYRPTLLSFADLTLDPGTGVLTCGGQSQRLSGREFQIMELFFRNPGTALVREKILEGVWGKNYFGDVKIVDVNIRRLRMKIEDEPSSPQHILTVWGYGYRWNA